jgi:hypothetical protein
MGIWGEIEGMDRALDGTPSGFFFTSRGLIQGDPFPSLLFVVVMEALSRMMTATIDTGLLIGFSMGSRNNEELVVSHLLFIDDTLIFCDVNSEQIRHLHIFSYVLKQFWG